MNRSVNNWLVLKATCHYTKIGFLIWCSLCTGTDRSNIVQTLGPDVNYPIPWEKNENNMFENVEVLWTSTQVDLDDLSSEDIAVSFASAGYYRCQRSEVCADSVEAKTPMNQLLNNAPASFEGALLRFRSEGTYYYICSRNNNFTNRSQKGRIVVREANK